MKNFSTSIQRRKRGFQECRHSLATKTELQDLIDQHVAGGADVLKARNMTFAALAEHCKETRYCEAFYDEQGGKLYGVREPKNFTSMINRLVSLLGHPKAE